MTIQLQAMYHHQAHQLWQAAPAAPYRVATTPHHFLFDPSINTHGAEPGQVGVGTRQWVAQLSGMEQGARLQNLNSITGTHEFGARSDCCLTLYGSFDAALVLVMPWPAVECRCRAVIILAFSVVEVTDGLAAGRNQHVSKVRQTNKCNKNCSEVRTAAKGSYRLAPLLMAAVSTPALITLPIRPQ
jgi:hypothetical protein